MSLAAAVVLLLCLIGSIDCHGRLIEPPGRSSAWRYGFKTPTNVNDHELFCGGFTRQWSRNGGKCGVCGDPYDAPQPRTNEAGGKYGTGTLVRSYQKGATIDVVVELTAHHRGFFEVRLCPTNSSSVAATQECMDRHVLTHTVGAGGSSTRYYPTPGNGKKQMQVVLPAGLVCAHCVMQWRYVAGNNWGVCENGTGMTGCGPQEEFRACADVRITSGASDSEITKQQGVSFPERTQFTVPNKTNDKHSDHHQAIPTLSLPTPIDKHYNGLAQTDTKLNYGNFSTHSQDNYLNKSAASVTETNHFPDDRLSQKGYEDHVSGGENVTTLHPNSSQLHSGTATIIVVAVVSAFALILALIAYMYRKRQRIGERQLSIGEVLVSLGQRTGVVSQTFSNWTGRGKRNKLSSERQN